MALFGADCDDIAGLGAEEDTAGPETGGGCCCGG